MKIRILASVAVASAVLVGCMDKPTSRPLGPPLVALGTDEAALKLNVEPAVRKVVVSASVIGNVTSQADASASFISVTVGQEGATQFQCAENKRWRMPNTQVEKPNDPVEARTTCIALVRGGDVVTFKALGKRGGNAA